MAQFKKADAEANQSTGSAAKSNEFIYYKDLLFLKPTLQHKDVLSTLKLPTTHTPTTLPYGFQPYCPSSAAAAAGPSHYQYWPGMAPSHPIVIPNAASFMHNAPMPFLSYRPPIPSPSSSVTKRVPEYDQFAKKKLKVLKTDEEQLTKSVIK